MVGGMWPDKKMPGRPFRGRPGSSAEVLEFRGHLPRRVDGAVGPRGQNQLRQDVHVAAMLGKFPQHVLMDPAQRQRTPAVAREHGMAVRTSDCTAALSTTMA